MKRVSTFCAIERTRTGKAVFSSACAVLTMAWLCLSVVSPARAGTMYDWTFSSADCTSCGSGALTVNGSDSVTVITGNYLGANVLSVATPGSSCFETCDNAIFPASGPYGFLDSNGLSFLLTSGAYLNISGGWLLGLQDGYVAKDSFYQGASDTCIGDDCRFGEFSISEVSSTPLPAGPPLFTSGLGLVGYLARRKKRASSALAATC